MKHLSLPVLLLVPTLLLVLAGCGAPEETLEPKDGYGSVDIETRLPVPDVTAIRLEPSSGGLILHATGVPPTQGYWDVGLVRDRGEDQTNGVLSYKFLARPPVDGLGQPISANVGSVASRQLDAAVFISDAQLEGIRQIVVTGAQSSRSARR